MTTEEVIMLTPGSIRLPTCHKERADWLETAVVLAAWLAVEQRAVVVLGSVE